MKIAPTRASGPRRESPRCTAPTRTPMAMAKAAGSAPLNNRARNHARARPGAALGRTLKNFHSLPSVKRRSIAAFCLKKPAFAQILAEELGSRKHEDVDGSPAVNDSENTSTDWRHYR